MTLLELNEQPLDYRQLSRFLEEEIRQKYKPGDLLPPERILAGSFGIDISLLRSAIDELIRVGLVVRNKNDKIQVNELTLDYPISDQSGFTSHLNSLNYNSGVKLLQKNVILPKGGILKYLDISESEMVIWLEILRLVDDKPFCVSSHFIPYLDHISVFNDYQGGSFHTFMKELYGIKLVRTETLVSARIPQNDEAVILGMPEGMPVIRTKSVNINPESGMPVEYVVSRFRSDSVQLQISL